MENNQTPQNIVAKSIIPLSKSMLMSHVVFAIEDGSNSKLVRISIFTIGWFSHSSWFQSNDQLYLSPSSSRTDSRRMSKILVRPFSRNDVLYSGSISRQVETNDSTSNIDDQKEASRYRVIPCGFCSNLDTFLTSSSYFCPVLGDCQSHVKIPSYLQT